MARDQLEQQHPAEVSAASAHAMHHNARHLNLLQKDANTQDSTSDIGSSSSKDRKLSLALHPTNSCTSTSSPTTEQRSHKASVTERDLAQQQTLRQLNGTDSAHRQKNGGPQAGSQASTQPVLVREYTSNPPPRRPSRLSGMKGKRNSKNGRDSAELPPLESFSFQDILASIDPEVHNSIDKIAEICGRSKLSLADEYSSHMPPQGEFTLTGLQEQTSPVAIPRLEPVEEASSTHEVDAQSSRGRRSRVTPLSLVGGVSLAKCDLPSTPVTATSAVASHTRSTHHGEDPGYPGHSESRSSYIPQILSWLRNSQTVSTRSQTSRRDSTASNSLQRILGANPETPMQ